MPKGAGQNVYSEDIARESALQETYAGILCRDNGLPTLSASNGAPRCDYRAMSQSHWAVFVNAGVYDIDRRCDGYLEWLHEVKRSRQPLTTQLTKTRALALDVLKLTNAADFTIELVGLAFGYALDTFTNFNSSLIFEIESSTVQQLVLDRQERAKTQISGIDFSSKPEAMHALRGYLRICMPFTIETDINTTLVGGTQNRMAPEGVVEINADTVGALSARNPVVIINEPTGGSENARRMFPTVANKTDREVIAVQRMLCDPVPNGKVGENTRVAIAVLEETLRSPGATKGMVDEDEYRLVMNLPGFCDVQLYKNFYERITFGSDRDFFAFVRALNRALPDSPLPEDVPYTSPTFRRDLLREKIKQLRAKNLVTVDPGIPDDQLTLALANAI